MHSLPMLLAIVRLILNENRRRQIAAEIVRKKLYRWRSTGRVDMHR